MAHAQKPDFVFRRNGRVHLNRRGASVQSTTHSRGERISGSNAGYTMFRGSVKGTGYPLHSPVPLHFPSRASPCAITFQLESTRIPSPILQLTYCEAYLSPTTSVQVKNPWSYTSKPTRTLVPCRGTTISRASPHCSPQTHLRPQTIVRPSASHRITFYPHYPGCISYPSSVQRARTCSYTAIALSKLLSSTRNPRSVSGSRRVTNKSSTGNKTQHNTNQATKETANEVGN